MKKVLIAAGVLVVAFVVVAWWQGWFKIEKTKTDDGQTHVGVKLNKEKFQQDRDKLKKAAAERSKGLKDRLARLRDKAKGLTGADKEKANQEIDALSKKHEAIESKIKDLEGVSEDKFEGLKKALDADLQDADKEGDK
jgi:ERCC4-type nuclease